MNALQALLRTAPGQVDSLEIQQVVTLCGTGKLTDGSGMSENLRGYLQIAKSENLFQYAQTCLQVPFEKSGMVLQDLVNELGRRLDYTVENGLYQGKVNAIGFDGIWAAPDGHAILSEVKTSDAYRINLDTIAGYREQLIAAGKMPKRSSVLLIVGREDTGDLEAQVRGSIHAWSFRIISIDALIKLVKLKESAELASAAKIHDLLVPFEYTRVDKIIDIAFTVAEESTEQVDDAVEAGIKVSISDVGNDGKTQQHTPSAIIDEVRASVVAKLSGIHSPLVKKSRALYWSTDKSVRVAITISKEYKGGDFWYAYHPAWDTFLSEGGVGLFALGCVGRNDAYVIPFAWIHKTLSRLYTTDRDDKMYWHVSMWPSESGAMELRLNDGSAESLEPFKLAL